MEAETIRAYIYLFRVGLTMDSAVAVEPLQEQDLDTFTTIYWDAFNPLEADMILPMIYPLGLQPDLRQRLHSRLLKSLGEDPTGSCFCARDSSTGNILGVSWWAHVADAAQTEEELDTRYAEAKARRSGGVEVEGMNQALEDNFFRAAFYSEAHTMGTEPYMTLKLLAVRPECARKGVGSVLLRHGLERVDQLNLPAFIHAGVQAKALYERYGFNVVSEMPCNALDHGGRSSGRHWCMVRSPQGRDSHSSKDV